MNVLHRTARRVAQSFGRESFLVRLLRPAYEKVLDWTSRGQGIAWTVNGVAYRVDPHYRHQMAPEYDPEVAAFLRERVKPGHVCLDVGANVGIYVLQFAHWSRPNGRVVAFEPNARTLDVLRRHVRFNQLEERVTVVPAAVGAVPGETVFYAADTDGMSRLGAPNRLIADRATPQTVPVVTLDGWCAAAGVEPDWLLVDIEGYEFAALAGARDLIRRRRPDLGLVVEMHPDLWLASGTSFEQAAALLDDLGLVAVPLTGQHDPLREYGLVHLAYR